MRYGKIYYYDRIGNKVQDEEPVIKDAVHHFSINSPRIKVHANVPFDENLVITGVKSLNDLDAGLMTGRLTTQDLISFDQPTMPAELDDLNFGPVDSPLAVDRGYSIHGDRNLRQRSAYNQVFTPLNDLKDPDDPKNELARAMDKIDLNKLPTLGPYDSGYEDDLCEDCRGTCHSHAAEGHRGGLRSETDAEDSDRMRFKLREHVDQINWDLMQKDKRRVLLPMNVLPPFANRPDEIDERMRAQKERYRIELEDDINKRRMMEADVHDRDQDASNLGNRADAQAYANEQEELKAVERINNLKDAEFNRQQAEARKRQAREEENKVEWWESRSQFGDKLERDRKHITDQLRRNESLRYNVQQLQDFEDKFKQQREANHLMRYRQYDNVREKVKEQTELTRPEAARRQRETLESVWQSWADAHRVNDRRYRVLQEYDSKRHRPLQPMISSSSHQPHVECDVKRCRRCRRPMAKRVAFVN